MSSGLVVAAVVSAVAIVGARVPPEGCGESSTGVRHCLSDKPFRSVRDRQYPDAHPATVARPARPYYSVGQVVDTIDADALVSGRYGQVRGYR